VTEELLNVSFGSYKFPFTAGCCYEITQQEKKYRTRIINRNGHFEFLESVMMMMMMMMKTMTLTTTMTIMMLFLCLFSFIYRFIRAIEEAFSPLLAGYFLTLMCCLCFAAYTTVLVRVTPTCTIYVP
jgi:hypothetical protein